MLIDLVTLLGWIAGTFAATNLDNLVLLVNWLLDGRRRVLPIFSGYLLGMLVLLVLAGGFGLGSNLISLDHVGLLGLIPILLGLRGLYAAWYQSPELDETTETLGGRFLPFALAATQVANGVDTVLVFGPLLADTEQGFDLVIIAGFAVMSCAWFGLALFLRKHLSRLQALERYGHWIGPIVLILAGFYILENTGTDVLPGR